MAPRISHFICARAVAIHSAIAVAIFLGANVARSEALSPSLGERSQASMHPISDTSKTGDPGTFADIAERVAPAVISVTSLADQSGKALSDQPPRFGKPDQDAPKPQAQGMDDPETSGTPDESIAIGSGFFVSADGYAVTSSHVVSGRTEVRTSDGKVYPARLVGSDSLSGLALIKVDGRTDLAYVGLADRPPRVGDWILTVGNPFGLGGTVTAGIVSAREREIEHSPSEGFIQIDAPINSGDSGGPTFNTDGEVIGVNSMIYSPSGGYSGVAFAVPADTVRTVILQLKDKGAVTRGSIGAEVQSITPEIADGLGLNDVGGVLVADVQNSGPAAKAGMRSGDVITKVSGEPVRSAGALTKKIQAMTPGSSVQLVTVREGKESSMSVTLGQLSDQTGRLTSGPR